MPRRKIIVLGYWRNSAFPKSWIWPWSGMAHIISKSLVFSVNDEQDWD